MSNDQFNHLIKMANQIALNLSAAGDEDEVARQTFEHINKFWSPLMKQQIRGYISRQDDDLLPAASKAIAKLS